MSNNPGSETTATGAAKSRPAARPTPANDHPENREGAAKATEDNDLTTGHSAPDDGGDDNAKGKK